MLRAVVQLTAVGYVIKAVFDSDSLWLVVLLLAGCGSSSKGTRTVTLALDFTPNAVHAPLYAAAAHGDLVDLAPDRDHRPGGGKLIADFIAAEHRVEDHPGR